MASSKRDSSQAACVASFQLCGLDEEGDFGVSCPWHRVRGQYGSGLAKLQAFKPLAPQEKSPPKM